MRLRWANSISTFSDIQMTRTIVEAARPFGIAGHDHLIVGRDAHASLKALK